MRTKEVGAGALQTSSTSPQTTTARASSESRVFKYRSTIQRYVKKVEKYLPKNPGKQREVVQGINNKCVYVSKQREERRKTNLVMRN